MKKIFLIAIAVLALAAMLVGDGLGILAFLKTQQASVAPQVQSGADRAPKAPEKPTAANAQFVELPQFVVTIPTGADGGSVYLQLAMSFLTEKKQAIADFDKLMPIIKSQIISDVMASGVSPSSDPMKLKHVITTDSLVVANMTVSQSDTALGKAPFLGAYITTFLTQ
ncbi:flagellar basal body-associated FliL family protein [Thioclava sp. BHET1]|nr:flagellar basal body-associated FliL family protein [Thioclava sp. BHET1]